jgi:cysteine desulfuration protein SufE
MILAKRKKQLLEDWKLLPSWEDRYGYLIHLGKELTPLAETEKNDINLVRGCQSSAWLIVEKNNDHIEIRGDADGLITKGTMALLMQLYSGVSIEEMKQEDFVILEELEIAKHLSPNRANGLIKIIEKIKQ